ncbi:MAG: hypothetical protein AAB541_03530 [Patescibacteria group bacterium]
MNLRLFYENMLSLRNSLESTQLISNLRELIPKVVAYRNEPSDTTKEDLDSALDTVRQLTETVVQSVSKVPHSGYFISSFHIDKFLNLDNPSHVQELVYEDLFIAHEKIDQLVNEGQKIFDTFSSLISSLDSLDYEIAVEGTHYLIGFEFLKEAKIENTKELEGYLATIRKILYNYACLSEEVGESNPPVIHTVSKGSPLILDLSWVQENLPQILTLIGLTVIFYLSKKEKTQKITEYEQLIIQDIPEKERTKLFKRAFDTQKNRVFNDEAIDKHIQELVAATKKKSKDRAKAEQKNFLRRGVTDLIDLLDKGAKVEVYEPSTEENKEASSENINKNSTVIYTKYRQVEQKDKFLGISVQLKLPKRSRKKS